MKNGFRLLTHHTPRPCPTPPTSFRLTSGPTCRRQPGTCCGSWTCAQGSCWRSARGGPGCGCGCGCGRCGCRCGCGCGGGLRGERKKCRQRVASASARRLRVRTRHAVGHRRRGVRTCVVRVAVGRRLPAVGAGGLALVAAGVAREVVEVARGAGPVARRRHRGRHHGLRRRAVHGVRESAVVAAEAAAVLEVVADLAAAAVATTAAAPRRGAHGPLVAELAGGTEAAAVLIVVAHRGTAAVRPGRRSAVAAAVRPRRGGAVARRSVATVRGRAIAAGEGARAGVSITRAIRVRQDGTSSAHGSAHPP